MDQILIYNIEAHYAREFGLMDYLDELKEVIKNHGDDPFHIFWYMSFVKNFLIVSKSEMFAIEVPSQREYHFLEDLKKKCYIQVKNRRTEKEPIDSEFLDEICFTINVFK